MAEVATATILLHGALGDASQLAPLAARLTAAGEAQPLIVELDAHGRTPLGTRPFAIATFGATVLAAMDDAGIARANVFGYSMGGYVALHLAAVAPERIARVATLATKLAWTPAVAARETAMLDAATMRTKVPRFAIALEARHTAVGWESLLDHTAALLRALGDRPLVTPDVLASIAQPVRIGVGDRDTTVSIDECVAAMRALPAGELEVHPRTPHPFEKAPLDRLERSVIDFFA